MLPGSEFQEIQFSGSEFQECWMCEVIASDLSFRKSHFLNLSFSKSSFMCVSFMKLWLWDLMFQGSELQECYPHGSAFQ